VATGDFGLAMIEQAEEELDRAAATLRRIRIAVAAGEMPHDGVLLTPHEVSLVLDAIMRLPAVVADPAGFGRGHDGYQRLIRKLEGP
jgi:hypothetical protein